MLKDNATYQKQADALGENNEVNLLSKDQEINFSNKIDDEDELDIKGASALNSEGKPNNDMEEGISVEEDISTKAGKPKNKEEQKEFFHVQDKSNGKKPNVGRGKMQEQTIEPTVANNQMDKSPLSKQP